MGHQSIGNYLFAAFAWFACCTFVNCCHVMCMYHTIHISDISIQYPYIFIHIYTVIHIICRWNGKPLPGAGRNSGSQPLRRWGHRHGARKNKASEFVQEMEEVYDDFWMGLTSGRAASSTGQPMAKSKGASSGRGSVFCKSGHKLLLQKNNSHFAQEPSTADFGSIAKVLVQFCMVLCMSINCYHGLKPLRDCGSCQ